MKDRSIVELLKLLDKEIDGPLFYSGLCFLITSLFVNGELSFFEQTLLDNYIRKNKPYNVKHAYFPYWWPRMEKEPRHKFIQKLIKREERWNRRLQVLKFWSSWGH